jgi:hypothetical protein
MERIPQSFGVGQVLDLDVTNPRAVELLTTHEIGMIVDAVIRKGAR